MIFRLLEINYLLCFNFENKTAYNIAIYHLDTYMLDFSNGGRPYLGGHHFCNASPASRICPHLIVRFCHFVGDNFINLVHGTGVRGFFFLFDPLAGFVAHCDMQHA